MTNGDTTTSHADRVEQLAWQHALHEEQVLNERAGLFLVAQGMMLSSYASLLASVGARSRLVFGIIGVVLCGVWVILNLRQVGDLTVTTATLKEVSPSYSSFLDRRGKQGGFRSWDKPILAWGLPLIVAVVWLTLLLNGTGVLGL